MMVDYGMMVLIGLAVYIVGVVLAYIMVRKDDILTDEGVTLCASFSWITVVFEGIGNIAIWHILRREAKARNESAKENQK